VKSGGVEQNGTELSCPRSEDDLDQAEKLGDLPHDVCIYTRYIKAFPLILYAEV
jgi:hypothetical protein